MVFRSEEDARAWCVKSKLPWGTTMTLDQCWEMALRWYAGRLDPEWRGRSARDAHDIFAEVGLAGDFWRMV